MEGRTGAGVVFSLFLVGLSACGSPASGSAGGAGGDTTSSSSATGGTGGAGGPFVISAYDPNHVIDVALTMAPADWDALRHEANDLEAILGGDCLAGPKASVYDYYPAAVTIDGQEFPQIDVRKKGFIGSLSVGRPSLKLKLDAHDTTAHFFEASKITLNNVKQDSSLIRTCLAFETFAAVGVPAARCTFAHVTVNGSDLGVYANLESLGNDELAERFGDGTGNLYEGVVSDFRPDWEDTYEKKSNTADPDRSDLQALTDALQAPDAELLAKVEPLVDMDAFLSFWATESLIESWDGYTNGQNNHLAYHDPATGKLFFLPWGPDGTFGSDGGIPTAGRPLSVYATSELPRRLYGLPEVRAQYRTRVLDLVDKTLVSGPTLAEIDRMEALLAPLADKGDGAWKDQVELVRQWVKDRPSALEAELAAGPADYTFTPAGNPCLVSTGAVSGTFKTTMGTLEKNNPFGTGSGAVHFDLNAMPVDAGVVGAAAGMNGAQPTLLVLGALPGGKLAILVFLVDPTVLVPGDAPLDLQSVFGVYGTTNAQNEFQSLGWLDNGSVHFDKGGLNANDEIAGTFTTDVFTPAP